MYPVDRAFVLKYQHFKQDMNFNQDNSLELDADESKIFAFIGLVVLAENKSFLFVAHQQSLYLAIENGKLEEVKGL